MPTSDIFDLDAVIGDTQKKALAARRFKKVKLFGDEFRVTTDYNVYAMVLSADDESGGSVLDMLHSLLHKDDLEQFKKTLASQAVLTAEVLGKIIDGMVGLSAERPTKKPAGSSSGRTPKGSTRTSAGSASSRAKLASVT